MAAKRANPKPLPFAVITDPDDRRLLRRETPHRTLKQAIEHADEWMRTNRPTGLGPNPYVAAGETSSRFEGTLLRWTKSENSWVLTLDRRFEKHDQQIAVAREISHNAPRVFGSVLENTPERQAEQALHLLGRDKAIARAKAAHARAYGDERAHFARILELLGDPTVRKNTAAPAPRAARARANPKDGRPVAIRVHEHYDQHAPTEHRALYAYARQAEDLQDWRRAEDTWYALRELERDEERRAFLSGKITGAKTRAKRRNPRPRSAKSMWAPADKPHAWRAYPVGAAAYGKRGQPMSGSLLTHAFNGQRVLCGKVKPWNILDDETQATARPTCETCAARLAKRRSNPGEVAAALLGGVAGGVAAGVAGAATQKVLSKKRTNPRGVSARPRHRKGPAKAPAYRTNPVERADGTPIVNIGPTCGGLVNLGTLLVVLPDGRQVRYNRSRHPLVTYSINRIKWVPLRRGGRWNTEVRRLLRGKTGAYAVRRAGERTTLYVGESHTGRDSKDPHRFTRTILRHFQRGFTPDGRQSEWTFHGPDDLDVALYLAPPTKAREVEGQLVLELEPANNRIAFVPSDDGGDVDAETPF